LQWADGDTSDRTIEVRLIPGRVSAPSTRFSVALARATGRAVITIAETTTIVAETTTAAGSAAASTTAANTADNGTATGGGGFMGPWTLLLLAGLLAARARPRHHRDDCSQ
jgi:hypothetical protein